MVAYMLTIKKDIDLITEVNDYDVLLVGTNVYNRLANGWQLDVKYNYPLVHKANMETKYGDNDKLGKIIQVKADEHLTVCLCYINKGYNFRPDIESDYLSYSALEECLHQVNVFFKGKRIACPILGSSKFDGNGDKDRIIALFEQVLTNVDITLYDYVQTSFNDRKMDMIRRIMEAKKVWKETKDRKPYITLVKERKDYENRLKKINNLTIFEQ